MKIKLRSFSKYRNYSSSKIYMPSVRYPICLTWKHKKEKHWFKNESNKAIKTEHGTQADSGELR